MRRVLITGNTKRVHTGPKRVRIENENRVRLLGTPTDENFRLLEDNDFRITENGDFRVLE